MDEKEIEGMARVLALSMEKDSEMYEMYWVDAIKLYKAGYRKIEPYITEEMIVRADDDDKTKIERLTKERNFWRGQAHKHFKNMGEVRKETAREIVDLMLTEYECYIPAEIANEIAKKYDLEETENG